MVSTPRDKSKLPVDDLEDWQKDGSNDDDGEDEGETFDWSKPIHIEEESIMYECGGSNYKEMVLLLPMMVLQPSWPWKLKRKSWKSWKGNWHWHHAFTRWGHIIVLKKITGLANNGLQYEGNQHITRKWRLRGGLPSKHVGSNLNRERKRENINLLWILMIMVYNSQLMDLLLALNAC